MTVDQAGRRSAPNLGAAVLLAVEVVGASLMWAPVPLAWMWIGARVYQATGSLAIDFAVVLGGFLTTIILMMKGLSWIDERWVALRQRAGHRQREGALSQVVVISATLGLLGFFVWYYVLSDAYVLPFMPSQ